MNTINKHILLLNCLLMLILLACNSENNSIIDEPEPKNPTTYLFPITIGQRWIMKNDLGDSAYFEAVADEEYGYSPQFWSNNWMEVSAINLTFTYWKNNMKQKLYFIVIPEDGGYVFAGLKNPVVANYNLEHYSNFFLIPNHIDITGVTEIDTTSIQVGINSYKRSRSAQWTNIGEIMWDGYMKRLWNVVITFMDETKTPTTYVDEFQFLEDIGIYKFMGYELVESY